jgi:serine protease Do
MNSSLLSRLLFITIIIGFGYGGYRLYQKQRVIDALIEHLNNESQEPVAAIKRDVIEKIVSPERLWSKVQAEVKDTVVQVFVQVAKFNWLQPYATPSQGESAGTAFFIDDQGYLITNAHVISQAQSVAVQIPTFGKERLGVDIIGVCFDRDIALLRLRHSGRIRMRETLGKIPHLRLGDSNQVSRSDEIMTLGFPLGQQSLKSTVGVVSGRESLEFRQYIQIDAAINPGNSGGPSLDYNGEVVGINTASIPGAQNVGYIIPVNELKIILDDLYKKEHLDDKILRKPYLGILYNASTLALSNYLGNPPGGVYISEVYKNSILDKAGVKKGDVLFEINGKKLDLFGQISVSWLEDKISVEDYIFYLKYGQQITLKVYRKGEPLEVKLNFEHSDLPPVRTVYPDFEAVEYEVVGGMVIMELRNNHIPLLLNMMPTLIQYGESKNQLKSSLIITHVFPGSAAQRSRVIGSGMRLKEVNGIKMSTLSDFRKAVLKSGQNSFMKVRTKEGIVAVFPLLDVLRDEPRLSATYHYPISETIKELMMMKQYDDKKKARPVASTAAAPVQP